MFDLILLAIYHCSWSTRAPAVSSLYTPFNTIYTPRCEHRCNVWLRLELGWSYTAAVKKSSIAGPVPAANTSYWKEENYKLHKSRLETNNGVQDSTINNYFQLQFICFD